MSSGWRKSSHSKEHECVEVWRKSSRSGLDSCVELAGGTGIVAFRDSTDPDGPRLRFAPADAAALIRWIQQG